MTTGKKLETADMKEFHWHIPEDCGRYTAGFKVAIQRELGGERKHYQPINWRLQGSYTSRHAWNEADLADMNGRTIVVEYEVVGNRLRERADDGAAWQRWYGGDR